MEKNSKGETKKKIDDFFDGEFSAKDAKKMKRLAMRHKIRLGEKRKKFCKKCFSSLKGKTRVTKEYKAVICEKCGQLNKFKLGNY